MRDYKQKGDNKNVVKDSKVDKNIQFAGPVEGGVTIHGDKNQPFSLPNNSSKEGFYMAIARWLLRQDLKTLIAVMVVPSLGSIFVFLD